MFSENFTDSMSLWPLHHGSTYIGMPVADPAAGWGKGDDKHDIYAATFGGHIFYDLFLQSWGGAWSPPNWIRYCILKYPFLAAKQSQSQIRHVNRPLGIKKKTMVAFLLVNKDAFQ